jgi:hypothetical protein
MTAPAEDPRGGEAECWCIACEHLTVRAREEAGDPMAMFARRFIVCPDCGNKRCPHATHHSLPCTGSNEPGQPGSAYVQVLDPPRTVEEARARILAAGRGDTGSGGEGFDLTAACEPVARSPKSVRRFVARPAGDRAQPTQELRKAIAKAVAIETDEEDWTTFDVADAVLALPAVAALLDAQAAVSRVEALLTAVRGYDAGPDDLMDRLQVSIGQVRRALDGTT